jgi:hypothetical protein
LDAVTPMVMVGLTQQIVGKPTLTVQQTHSRQNLFNGEIQMVTVTVMFLWALFETIVLTLRVFQNETRKAVPIQMEMAGPTHTENFQLQLRF